MLCYAMLHYTYTIPYHTIPYHTITITITIGLEQEAAPLVERRGAEAAQDDDDEEHLRRVGRPLSP